MGERRQEKIMAMIMKNLELKELRQEVLDYLSSQKNKEVNLIIYFNNNYGVSIVRNKYSFGNERKLFEVAVIKKNNGSFKLDYNTPVTDDVEGWLTPEEVGFMALAVALLPKQ